MSSRAKNSRPSAPVRIAEDEAHAEDYEAESGEPEDETGYNMVDMIGIIKQFQKQKSAKTSTRSAAFQQKKCAMILDARQKAEMITRSGVAHIEFCKARIDELQNKEIKSDEKLKDVVGIWTAHEEIVHSLLNIYPMLIEELSPRRATDINAASEMLETHPIAREASRRRLMKMAKKNMETGLENQKIMADSSTLIKHYKALLLS